MSEMVPTKDAANALRAFGLTYPGASIKSPWEGHLDLAVNDKTFAYLSTGDEPLRIGCKLPFTKEAALEESWCEPMGYGLGKSGWVTATPPGEVLDLARFKDWIDESYRAQAPRRLLKELMARAKSSPVG